MPTELIRNPIKVFRIMGENNISTVIQEDINVPDVNQDLFKILNCKDTITLKKCEILQDKVNAAGQVMVNILYCADNMGKPLASMDAVINFNQPIEISGAMPTMKEKCTATVENIECSIINSRKLNIRLILNIACKVEDIFDIHMIGDVRGLPDIQLLRETTTVKQIVGHKKDHFRVEHKINMDESMMMGKILRCDCYLGDKDYTLGDGKVDLKSNIEMAIVYETDSDPISIETIRAEQLFNDIMEINGVSELMELEANLGIESCSAAIKDNMIVVNMDMMAQAKAYHTYSTDTVVDAYSQSHKLDIAKETFKVNELIGTECTKTPVKETVTIDKGMPEIEELLYTIAKPIVGEKRILDNKVIVEGIVEVGMVYKTSFSGEPLCSMSEEIPFKQTIEIDDAKVDMQCTVYCHCNNVNGTMQSSQSAEVSFVLNCCAAVYKQIDKKALTKITETEHCQIDSNKIPSLTVYIVQKGDTLWSIAKRYNTTVDALVALNKIENPNKIYPCMKLLILKNIRAC